MASRSLAWILCASVTACASAPPPRVASAPASAGSRAIATRAAPVVLSGADQARELAATQRSVTAMRWSVQRRLEQARAVGDRSGIRCLDERLTEIDAEIRMLGEQRERFLFASDDVSHRDQIFRRVMTLRGRATEVSEEARRCEAADNVIEGSVTTVVLAAPR